MWTTYWITTKGTVKCTLFTLTFKRDIMTYLKPSQTREYIHGRNCVTHLLLITHSWYKNPKVPSKSSKAIKLWWYKGSIQSLRTYGYDIRLFHGQGVIECKLFTIKIKGAIINYFKTLLYGSIYSWKELCDLFSTQCSARNRKPTITDVLCGIKQKKKEIMQVYIN